MEVFSNSEHKLNADQVDRMKYKWEVINIAREKQIIFTATVPEKIKGDNSIKKSHSTSPLTVI